MVIKLYWICFVLHKLINECMGQQEMYNSCGKI